MPAVIGQTQTGLVWGAQPRTKPERLDLPKNRKERKEQREKEDKERDIDLMTAKYAEGFVSKCADQGVDPELLLKLSVYGAPSG